MAERLDPALADEAAMRLESVDPPVTTAARAQELVSILSFRRDMHEELR
jgi:hypothetical protein